MRDPENRDAPGEARSIEADFRASFDPALLQGLPGLRTSASIDPMDFAWSVGGAPNVWVPLRGIERCAVAVADLGAAVLTGARLPPSRFDVTAGAGEVYVVLGMDERHRSVVNGVAVPFASMGIGRPGARCVAHWPENIGSHQSFAIVRIAQDRVPSDWPRSGDLFSIRELSAAAVTRLRTFLADLFLTVARETPPVAPETTARRLTRLIEEIDLALRSSSMVPAPPALVTKGYLNLIDRIDDHISAHYAEPIRLEDVAEALRVSRRTIHNVMRRVRGSTFQDYLRTLRLRCVRFSLRHDESIRLVKQAAIRYGFAHQGRFAKDYADRFGETPSATLAHRTRPAETDADETP